MEASINMSKTRARVRPVRRSAARKDRDGEACLAKPMDGLRSCLGRASCCRSAVRAAVLCGPGLGIVVEAALMHPHLVDLQSTQGCSRWQKHFNAQAPLDCGSFWM